MTKTKITLFFEDNINLRFTDDINFVNLIADQLPQNYVISNVFGKIGTTGTSGNAKIYFQKNNPIEEPKFYPHKELANSNSRDMSTKIPALESDSIPFFVIDTDGVDLNNMCNKILCLEDSGIQKRHPTKWISGSSELLPSILTSIIDDRILSKWGLILVNPNKEGSIYSSLIKNNPNFDNILFGTTGSDRQYKSSALGFCYFNKNGESMRFIAADPLLLMLGGDKIKNQVGNALKIKIKDIWDEISAHNPDVLADSISEDISKYYKQIVDIILDDINISNKWKNQQIYKNAEESVFSIYVKKRKVDHPDYPDKLPKEILEKSNISNFEIQYFDFSKLSIN